MTPVSVTELTPQSPSSESAPLPENMGLDEFRALWRKLDDRERRQAVLELALRIKRLPKGAGEYDNRNIAFMGTWLSTNGGMRAFYLNFRDQLKDLPNIQLDMADPILLEALELENSLYDLVGEKARQLWKLRWATDKLGTIALYIEYGEKKWGRGWWPATHFKNYLVGSMGRWIADVNAGGGKEHVKEELHQKFPVAFQILRKNAEARAKGVWKRPKEGSCPEMLGALEVFMPPANAPEEPPK